jgi:hypothetical protein
LQRHYSFVLSLAACDSAWKCGANRARQTTEWTLVLFHFVEFEFHHDGTPTRRKATDGLPRRQVVACENLVFLRRRQVSLEGVKLFAPPACGTEKKLAPRAAVAQPALLFAHFRIGAARPLGET